MTAISSPPWKPSRVVAESSDGREFHSCHHPQVTNSVSLGPQFPLQEDGGCESISLIGTGGV